MSTFSPGSAPDTQVPTGPVWPPAPTSEPPKLDKGARATGILEFDPQNGIRLLFLIFLTSSIYLPFWMLRTARAVKRVMPHRPFSLMPIWILLVTISSRVILMILSAMMASSESWSTLRLAKATDELLAVTNLVINWIVVFRLRAAVNEILTLTSPHLRRFGWLGTFLFGAVYLQVRLDQRIHERTAEVLGTF